MRAAVLLSPEEGFVFSFLKSEKLGTDCARAFSVLRFTVLGIEAFVADLGTGAAEVRGVDKGKFLLGKSFLAWVFLETLFPKDVSLKDLS